MIDKSVERQALMGFAASAALLLLVTATEGLAVRSYGDAARWLEHTHAVIGELEGLAAALSTGSAARFGYLATGEPHYLTDRDAAVGRRQTHLAAVRALTADNAEQQKRIRDLEAWLTPRMAQVDEMIANAGAEGLQRAQRILVAQRVGEVTQQAARKVQEMQAAENSLLNTRTRADAVSARQLMGASVVMVLTVSGVLLWLCLRIRREMFERARSSVALQRANTGLEAANRELESFSYSVSHDLRSPLRAIDGFSRMLEEDYGPQLDEEGRRYIQTVRAGSQRMAALIDDLLTFSRLSRQALTRQRVDMTALARRAAAEILDGRPEPHPTVQIAELPDAEGDPALLRQVWTNLIANAVKYSAKSPAPEVHVRAERNGHTVRYEVQDNGVGFDMKYADKLFGVFQRLHTIDEYPGTGVGLAIVHRIVARHDGAVCAHGERGKGATFGFTLPMEA